MTFKSSNMATFFSAVYEVPYQWLTLLFDSMVNVVTTVNERGVLTLDRIKLALTGRSSNEGDFGFLFANSKDGSAGFPFLDG